jgi:hypothetical protein
VSWGGRVSAWSTLYVGPLLLLMAFACSRGGPRSDLVLVTVDNQNYDHNALRVFCDGALVKTIRDTPLAGTRSVYLPLKACNYVSFRADGLGPDFWLSQRELGPSWVREVVVTVGHRLVFSHVVYR